MWWAGFSLPVPKDVYGRAPTAFDSRSGASGCWVASRRVRRGKDAVAGVWRKNPFCSRRPRVSVRFCHWSLPVSVYSVCVRSPPSPLSGNGCVPGGEGKRYLRSCCRRRHSHCCRRWQVSGNVVTMPVFVGGEGRLVFRRRIAGFLRHSSELSDGPFFHDGATRSLAQ